MQESKLIAIGYWHPFNQRDMPMPQDYFKATTTEEQRTMLTGLWRSLNQSGLPLVKDFEDENVPIEERDVLISYLNKGKIHVVWRGYSTCRYRCDIPDYIMGHACLTDGLYIWPEGLSHYIERHNIWLPEPFISHVNANLNYQPADIDTSTKPDEGDMTWWKSFAKQVITDTKVL